MKRYIRSTIYNGFDESEFDEYQIYEIEKGIRENLEISLYANPKFDSDDMRQIRLGLEEELDVSWYADPKFDSDQMSKIREGLEKGIDVSWYADPKFDYNQMSQLATGLILGLDVSSIADPQLSSAEMALMIKGITTGVDVSPYIHAGFSREQLEEIRQGLIGYNSVDITKYANIDFSPDEMRKIRLELESDNYSEEPTDDRDYVQPTFQFVIYEIDAQGDEIESIGHSRSEKAAISKAKKLIRDEGLEGAHVVLVPDQDPDDDPSIAEWYEYYCKYEPYEVIWSSI